MKKLFTFAFSMALGLMLFGRAAHADGKAVYDAKCKMCHGEDGKKKPNMNMEGCLDAVTKGKGTMKPTAGLSAEDAKASCDYMKTLK